MLLAAAKAPQRACPIGGIVVVIGDKQILVIVCDDDSIRAVDFMRDDSRHVS